jgi:hypothetical protein
MKDELAKLKGIKPIEEISISGGDYTNIYLIVASLLIVIIISTLIAVLLKGRRKRRKKLSRRELAMVKLKELDFTNTKEAVYNFTVNSKILVDETQKDKLYSILDKLEEYKYKKETPKLKDEDIELMKNFIRELKL